MTDIGESHPLSGLKVDIDNLYEALDDPQKGVALVEMPDGLNPSDLVRKFRELKETYVSEKGLTLLYPALSSKPGYFKETLRSQEPSFINDLATLYEALFSIASDQVLAKAESETTERTIAGFTLLHTADSPFIANAHVDRYYTAVWFGIQGDGLTIDLPNDPSSSIDSLPESHVLFTRQRDWHLLSKDSYNRRGIRHEVIWAPKSENDSRSVGLFFVGDASED